MIKSRMIDKPLLFILQDNYEMKGYVSIHEIYNKLKVKVKLEETENNYQIYYKLSDSYVQNDWTKVGPVHSKEFSESEMMDKMYGCDIARRIVASMGYTLKIYREQ